MNIFRHADGRPREDVRAKTLAKVRLTPEPLPEATAGSVLAYRLTPKSTRKSLISSLRFVGTSLLVIGGLTIATLFYFVGVAAMKGSLLLMLVIGCALLVSAGGSWMLLGARAMRSVAHLPEPHLELDDIDLRPATPFQLALVLARGASIENVTVDLVCDETVIETTETELSPYDPAVSEAERGGHVRGVMRTDDGTWVHRSRTPSTARIYDRRLIERPVADSTAEPFEWIVNFEIPTGAQPNGETADHKVVWAIEMKGAMADGFEVDERFIVRVRE